MHVLAVDHYVWTTFAFLETESCPHIDSAFQPVLFRVAQHAIQYVLRALQETIRSQADTDFGFLVALHLGERKRLIGDAAAAL